MNLGILFSLGSSLHGWDDDGMLTRELQLFNEFAEHCDTVVLFTYGDDDYDYEALLADNVRVVPKSTVEDDKLYSILLPVIHREIFASLDVIRTTQFAGSWSAVVGKALHGQRFVHRSGYIWSLFDDRRSEVKYRVKRLAERITCWSADAIVTTSRHGFDYINSEYSPSCRHEEIPNYVETDVFKPLDTVPESGSVCFVGRLVEQKNLSALIAAVSETPYRLTLVGDGPKRAELEQQATDLGADVTFLGTVPNEEIVDILNDHELFVLPSHHEGLPKSLLEAMATGRAVVASDVVGNTDVVTDGEDGVLCEKDSESLRSAITRVMEDDDLRERIGQSARETIEEEYSLKSVARREFDVIVDE